MTDVRNAPLRFSLASAKRLQRITIRAESTSPYRVAARGSGFAVPEKAPKAMIFTKANVHLADYDAKAIQLRFTLDAGSVLENHFDGGSIDHVGGHYWGAE